MIIFYIPLVLFTLSQAHYIPFPMLEMPCSSNHNITKPHHSPFSIPFTSHNFLPSIPHFSLTMAVDMYSENFAGIVSPRLSFSNDFKEDETTTNPIDVKFPCRLDHSPADSTFDFAFNVDSTNSFHSSAADELFSNGKILPTTPTLMPCLDPTSTLEAKKKSLKEFLEDSIEEDEEEPNTTARSFWKFRRSNTLNCDTNQRKGLIGSWKILSRSGSTGNFLEKIVEEDHEIDNNKPSRKSFWKFSRNNSLNSEWSNGSSKILRSDSTSDEYQNFDYDPRSKLFRRSSSLNCETRKGINQGLVGSDKFLPRSYSSGSAPIKQQQCVHISTNSGQKRQIKSNLKGYGYGVYNGNVRVSSVLNLPSPYISRVDLFGLGLFCSGNAKFRKKRK